MTSSVTLSRVAMFAVPPEGATNVTAVGGRSVWVATEAASLVLLWLLTVLGNLLVCLVIYRSRRLQSTTNYFVVSLAVTDLGVAVAIMPWLLGSVLAGRWVFGYGLCKLVRFAQVVLPASTMYVLASICVDRFYTIIYPLSFKVTRTRAKQMSATSWLTAAILATPCLYFYDVVTSGGDDSGDVVVCRAYVPNTWPGVVYVLLLANAVVTIPVVVMTVGYTKVVKYVWTMGTGGRTLQRTTNSVPRPKVKMIKMIMATSVVNVALVAAAHVVQLWHCSLGGARVAASGDPERTAFVAAAWLYFASAASKPAIYLGYNSNFRRGCREVFCMSTMKCYRSNLYTITTTSKLGKRNHVGMSAADQASQAGRDYRSADLQSRTFDRASRVDVCAWPLPNQQPSTAL